MASSSVTIAGAAIPAAQTDAHGVVVQVTPAQATAGQGTPAGYVVRLTNTGSVTDTYYLQVTGLPDGVAYRFGQNYQYYFTIPPGAGNFLDVPLTLTPSAGTTPGAYPFTVTATQNTSGTPVTGSAAGTLTVVQNGVSVSLFPETDSTAPGATFDLTVYNTGSVTDTYDLALAGPAALVATLGAKKTMALAPGDFQTIKVTTTAVNFADPGDLGLTAIATSEGNTAVQGSDSTSLTIPTTQGLAANLSPSVKVLPVPGTTSFLLEVDNTGNAEDSYTATIMGTTGPVNATLAGLDGSPTQTIPIFRLPGLSTGAILINTDLTAFGQGTVTVQVQSLSDKAMTATATAQVSARQAVAAPTMTELPAPTGPFAYGQAVTLTATVALASGAGTPSGSVTFTVNGVPQAPVPLSVVNGQAQAGLTLNGLAAGTYQVQAFYAGTADFAASMSGVVGVVVSPAVPADGPQVIGVARYGYHRMPTEVVLTFNQPLDPSRAQDPANYLISSSLGRPVKVAAAVYDAANDTVTIYPSRRLNVHQIFVLTVNGEGPFGVTSTNGELLDGSGSGRPGGDFVTAIDRQTLAGPSLPDPVRHLPARWSAKGAIHAAHGGSAGRPAASKAPRPGRR